MRKRSINKNNKPFKYKKLKKDFNALQAEIFNNDFIISENRILKSKIEDIVDVSSEILAKVLVDKQSPFLKSVIVFFSMRTTK